MKSMTNKSSISVKTHDKLTKISEGEIRAKGTEILQNADHGIQTAVVGPNGKVSAVVGLNGFRYLPDPDPDPLEEIMWMALAQAKQERK